MGFTAERGDAIIACGMLEDEVKLAMSNACCTLPVVWVESGLHESPQRLREELLTRVGELTDARTILLAYTLCGNAMEGVGSKTARLIVPRFDDCIRMLLSKEEGESADIDIHSLYYTRGWLRGERSLLASYDRVAGQYGTQKARHIYHMMLCNYRAVTILNTGAFPPDECLPDAKIISERLGLELSVCGGAVRVLEKLFRGKWDSEFCIAQPGGQFTQNQFQK